MKEFNIVPILYIFIPIVLGIIINTILIKLNSHKPYLILISSGTISILYIIACSLYLGLDKKFALGVILILTTFFIILLVAIVFYIFKLIFHKTHMK